MARAARRSVAGSCRQLRMLLLVAVFQKVSSCGLGPSADFDKTRAGYDVSRAYSYNVDIRPWSSSDHSTSNPLWSNVQYRTDRINKLKPGRWVHGYRWDEVWLVPAFHTHPNTDGTSTDRVWHIQGARANEIWSGYRKIATLRATQPIWNAAVIKLFYFCGYWDDGTVQPSEAELRIDLYFPDSGTRRTIWRVEDDDKAMPTATYSRCYNYGLCTNQRAWQSRCDLCANMRQWKYAAVRIPLSAERYQIEITGLDGKDGSVAFDLVSFETMESCVPTWIPYYGVYNFVSGQTLQEGSTTLASCAGKCLASAVCDMFAYRSDSGECKLGHRLGKGSSTNPNDMCWTAPTSLYTAFELNCLTPAATYDVLLDSDGDYFEGAWHWDNCVESGTCTPSIRPRLAILRKLLWEEANMIPLMAGFGYFVATGTLGNQLPMERNQNVTVEDVLPASYLEAFKPKGTFYSWCTTRDANADDLTMRVHTVADDGTETVLGEASSRCPQGMFLRAGHRPLTFDGSSAKLRVQEQMQESTYPNTAPNALWNVAVTAQQLLIDVPVGLGCFSGYESAEDATQDSSNDVPKCLVICKEREKPVAAVSGGSCSCMDAVPYESLTPSSLCNTTCFGDKWMCGGPGAHNFYVASCPDTWERIGHFCYKAYNNADADTSGKAQALCTLDNAQLFAPLSSYEFNMVPQLLLSEGSRAYLGYDRILADGGGYVHFDGMFNPGFAELNLFQQAVPTCPVVALAGGLVAPMDACGAAQIICQKRIAEGWGTQEITESVSLVTRKASTNTEAFGDVESWWSPAEGDSSPLLEWKFSRQVMVSGFKISTKASQLLKTFQVQYKEEYMTNNSVRYYAPLSASEVDRHTFVVSHDMTMEDEFTVYIHMAYPKVSNWFAVMPTDYDEDAQVKVTLLGSTNSDVFVLSDGKSDQPQVLCPPETQYVLGPYKNKCVVDGRTATYFDFSVRDTTCTSGAPYAPRSAEDNALISSVTSISPFDIFTRGEHATFISIQWSADDEAWVYGDGTAFTDSDYQNFAADAPSIAADGSSPPADHRGTKCIYMKADLVWFWDECFPSSSRDPISYAWFPCEVAGFPLEFGDVQKTCRQADHSAMQSAGFQLLNAQPVSWAGHYSLLHAYQKDTLIAFNVCQMKTQCFRNGDGNVQCSPYSVFWKQLQGSIGCPAGFANVLDTCVRLTNTSAPFSASQDQCADMFSNTLNLRTQLDLRYTKEYLAALGTNMSVYIAFRRGSSGFVDKSGSALGDEFADLWAPDEPAESGDCVILDAWSSFRMRAVDCAESHLMACKPIEPANCPADFSYEGDFFNCFHFHPNTSREWDHIAASEYCRSKNSWLAVPSSPTQSAFITSVMKETNAVLHQNENEATYGAIGVVRSSASRTDDPYSMTINNVSPKPTPRVWDLFDTFKDGLGDGRACAFLSTTTALVTTGGCDRGSLSVTHYPICQYHTCYGATGSRDECVFPFTYKGRTYGHCTTVDSEDGSAWCPTQLTDGVTKRQEGTFVNCSDTCPVTDCPLGFLELALDGLERPLCLLGTSSVLMEDSQLSPQEQQQFCSDRGTRLLSLTSLFHLTTYNELRSSAFTGMDDVNVAVDGIYEQDDEPYAMHSSGRLVASYLLDAITTNFDDDLFVDTTTTCLVLHNDELRNAPCDSGNAYHICEANVEYTVSGPAANELCHFPFEYEGSWYTSCVYDSERGPPWCATAVNGTGYVDGDSWGYCSEDKHVTVDGPGAPRRCQLPFIVGQTLYENCTTLADVTVPDSAGNFWCSTANDADGVMLDTSSWGSCPDDAWPPGYDLCESPFYGEDDEDCQYTYHVIGSNQTEAEGFCAERGASLVNPMTADLQAQIEVFLDQKKNKTYFPNFNYVRTNAIKEDTVWYWQDKTKEQFNYTNWGDGVDPTGDGCVFLNVGTERPYKWEILPCDTPAYTSCRKLCPMGDVFFQDRCLSVDPDDELLFSQAEARCAARGEQLFTFPSNDTLQAFLQWMPDNLPVDAPYHVGLVACRPAFLTVTTTTLGMARRMRRPLNPSGEHQSWLTSDVNFVFEGSYTCNRANQMGWNFFLKPDDPIPLRAQLETFDGPERFICSGKPNELECPEGYFAYNDQCYKFSNETATFRDAHFSCYQEDGVLLVPLYYSQVQFFRHMASELNTEELTREHIWLGIDRMDKANVYTTSYGYPLNVVTDGTIEDLFQDSTGSDGADCVAMTNTTKTPGDESSRYFWTHQPCDTLAHYVCHYRGHKPKYDPCPETFPIYMKGLCLHLSSTSRTYAEAEVECARKTDGMSHLMSRKKMLSLYLLAANDEFDGAWVGLDNRNTGTTITGEGYPLEPAVLQNLPLPGTSVPSGDGAATSSDGSASASSTQATAITSLTLAPSSGRQPWAGGPLPMAQTANERGVLAVSFSAALTAPERFSAALTAGSKLLGVAGGCGAVRTGGYESVDCQERRKYVCLRTTYASCPTGFIRHHRACYKVEEGQKKADFSGAEQRCAHNASFVTADRNATEAVFLQALMASIGQSSYWVGLSSDEPEDTGLTFANWEPFEETAHSRFTGPPAMEAPACTMASQDDNFSSWREVPCGQRHHFICQYQGLPNCQVDYTPTLDSGYNCLKLSTDPGNFWVKQQECIGVGPNNDLALITSARMQTGVESFLRAQHKAGAPKMPAWLNYRGRVNAADMTSSYQGPAEKYWRGRIITYHNTRQSQEVLDMGKDATQNTIWREKCAAMDITKGAVGNWIRKECSKDLPAICEQTVCYSERGHQCIFPFINPDDGLTYHNCSAVDPNDIFTPWCATVVNATGHATRLARCLPYCFFEKPIITCFDPPPRPPLLNETDDGFRWRANWTSNWDGVVNKEIDQKVIYRCPPGYRFDSNNQSTVAAVCGNWTWVDTPQVNATCQPVQCPRELPQVRAGSPMNATAVAWNGLYEFETNITFRCPPGHVFEGVPRTRQDSWAVNPSQQSQYLTVACREWGRWQWEQLPACEPFDCVGPPPEAQEDVSTDWDNVTISFNHSVRLWCTPGVGWGFPSDGAAERKAVCQEDGNWTLAEVEKCILMPCTDRPPAKQGNQSFSYGLLVSNYTCPPAWEFPGGAYQLSVECLLETKVWEPPAVPSCIRRRCPGDPPEKPAEDMTVSWPERDGQPNRDLDTEITYGCPRGFVTWDLNLTSQAVMCSHDPDTDDMAWEPMDLVECNREWWWPRWWRLWRHAWKPRLCSRISKVLAQSVIFRVESW